MTAGLLLCLTLLLIDMVVVVAQEKESTSDRIAKLVAGSLTKTRKKSTAKKLNENDERKAEIEERQKLVPRTKNKIVKPIASYAEQKAKAQKMRAGHQSNKQGLRRIG